PARRVGGFESLLASYRASGAEGVGGHEGCIDGRGPPSGDRPGRARDGDRRPREPRQGAGRWPEARLSVCRPGRAGAILDAIPRSPRRTAMADWTLAEQDTIAILTFTRPPRNFMSVAAITELGDRLRELGARADVSVVVLTGGLPGYFVAHADL